jgi:3',5'-cyclic AMP phosphodiesterase CpdA
MMGIFRICFFAAYVGFLFLSCTSSGVAPEEEKGFSFAFLTDVHLNKGSNNCFEGLQQAIDHAKQNEADFILTGGDNCDIDVLKDDTQSAHELYRRFSELTENSVLPIYPALGNHDRFFGVEKDDPLYNEGLFEHYMKQKSHYSFDHKGWHFVVLNTANSVVDTEQKAWLKSDIAQTLPGTPTVLVVHVPFLTVYYPALQGRYTSADTFSNFKEIWDLFKGRNLKLVLQGHQHIYEEINVLNTQFITAGAVSANWWGGPYYGTQEGYLKVNVDAQNNISWEYIDYGWEAR